MSTDTSTNPNQNPANPAPAAPDPGQDIKDSFIAQYQRPEPSFQTVLSTPTATLLTAKSGAEQDYDQVTNVILDDTERTAMAGKRYVDQNEISLLIAKGLDQHPEIVKATEVPPVLLRQVVAQDTATGALITAGGALSEGGGDGVILTSATAQTLVTRVLAQVKAEMADPTTAPQTRSDFEVAFAEPFRMQAKQQQAAQQSKLAGQKATQPQAQQQADADQAAAETQLIDAFTRFVQQNP